MAEPLSLVASIVTIAGAGFKLSQTVYKAINTVRDAPDEISFIASEMAGLSSILESLGDLMRANPNLATRKLHSDTHTMLSKCEEVQKKVRRLVTKEGKLVSFLWLYRVVKVRALLDKIAAIKSSINTAVAVMNLALTSRATMKRETHLAAAESARKDRLRMLAETAIQANRQNILLLQQRQTDEALRQNVDVATGSRSRTRSRSPWHHGSLMTYTGPPNDTATWLYRLVFAPDNISACYGQPSTQFTVPKDNSSTSTYIPTVETLPESTTASELAEFETWTPVPNQSFKKRPKTALFHPQTNLPPCLPPMGFEWQPNISEIVKKLLRDWTSLSAAEIRGTVGPLKEDTVNRQTIPRKSVSVDDMRRSSSTSSFGRGDSEDESPPLLRRRSHGNVTFADYYSSQNEQTDVGPPPRRHIGANPFDRAFEMHSDLHDDPSWDEHFNQRPIRESRHRKRRHLRRSKPGVIHLHEPFIGYQASHWNRPSSDRLNQYDSYVFDSRGNRVKSDDGYSSGYEYSTAKQETQTAAARLHISEKLARGERKSKKPDSKDESVESGSTKNLRNESAFGKTELRHSEQMQETNSSSENSDCHDLISSYRREERLANNEMREIGHGKSTKRLRQPAVAREATTTMGVGRPVLSEKGSTAVLSTTLCWEAPTNPGGSELYKSLTAKGWKPTYMRGSATGQTWFCGESAVHALHIKPEYAPQITHHNRKDDYLVIGKEWVQPEALKLADIQYHELDSGQIVLPSALAYRDIEHVVVLSFTLREAILRSKARRATAIAPSSAVNISPESALLAQSSQPRSIAYAVSERCNTENGELLHSSQQSPFVYGLVSSNRGHKTAHGSGAADLAYGEQNKELAILRAHNGTELSRTESQSATLNGRGSEYNTTTPTLALSPSPDVQLWKPKKTLVGEMDERERASPVSQLGSQSPKLARFSHSSRGSEPSLVSLGPESYGKATAGRFRSQKRYSDGPKEGKDLTQLQFKKPGNPNEASMKRVEENSSTQLELTSPIGSTVDKPDLDGQVQVHARKQTKARRRRGRRRREWTEAPQEDVPGIEDSGFHSGKLDCGYEQPSVLDVSDDH